MLIPHRAALFETSRSALLLRRGTDDRNPADQLTISKRDNELRRLDEQRSGQPRRRRADTHQRQPHLRYDQEADQFHYVWPAETG
jgi:hypothetical protein